MNPGGTDYLEGGVCGELAWLRVTGRGSFKCAPAVKAFTASAVGQGGRRFLIDMRDCTGMDSTFMGVLAGLASQLQPRPGAVALFNLSDRNCAALMTLGLGLLLDLSAAEPGVAPPTLSRLDPVSGTEILAATVLSAHETLVAAVPGNEPKFKDLISQLKDEVRRKTPEPSGEP